MIGHVIYKLYSHGFIENILTSKEMRPVLNHRKHFSVSMIFKMSHFFCSWVYLMFLMVLFPLLVSIKTGMWTLKEGVSSPILTFFIEVENAYFLLV